MIELKTFSQKSRKNGKITLLIISVLAFASGIVNGFLGTGGGIILMYAMSLLPNSGIESTRDKFASVIAVILPVSLVSALFYGSNVDTSAAAPYLLPGMLGGIAGAILLSKLKPTFLKRLFAIMVIWAGISFIR